MDTQIGVQPLEILKWIGIVFAAGFIGYFGRYFSMMILEKIHKKKAGYSPEVKDKEESSTSIQSKGTEERDFKLEKKRIKLEKKKAKKA
ncbi:hypothetical protein ACFLXF_00715 [Chloroflexota bacterium]